jgi:hypothetical protein
MPQPSYNVHATSITAYAICWGFLMKLGEKGLLTRQEVLDSLDFGLAFVEENAKHFDDQTATDTARQLLESLMKTVSEGKGQRKSSRPDNQAPRE